MIVPDELKPEWLEQRKRAISTNSIDSVAAAQTVMQKIVVMEKRLDRMSETVRSLRDDNVRLNEALEKSRNAYLQLLKQEQDDV